MAAGAADRWVAVLISHRGPLWCKELGSETLPGGPRGTFSVPPRGLSASGSSGMEDRQVGGPVASGHRTGPGWVTPACVPCSDPPRPGASRGVDRAPARRPPGCHFRNLLLPQASSHVPTPLPQVPPPWALRPSPPGETRPPHARLVPWPRTRFLVSMGRAPTTSSTERAPERARAPPDQPLRAGCPH